MSRYFSGQGKVYIAKRDGSGVPQGFVFLGDCSLLGINLGRAGERSATGGSETPGSLSMGGSSPVIDMVLDDFAKENLAAAMYGQANAISGATVAAEALIARLGYTVPLVNINITSWTSLTHDSGSPVYTKNVDYSVNMETGSILFPASGSAIVDAQALRANYVFGNHEKVSAFTMASAFYWLRLEGWNTAMSPKQAVVLDVYKVKLMPTDGYPVISDGFAQMRLMAQAHYDENMSSTTANGNYLRIRQV